MAPRITPKEFEEMHHYDEFGHMAEVARKMGRSASTVRRYVKMKDCPPLVRHEIKELLRKK